MDFPQQKSWVFSFQLYSCPHFFPLQLPRLHAPVLRGHLRRRGPADVRGPPGRPVPGVERARRLLPERLLPAGIQGGLIN